MKPETMKLLKENKNSPLQAIGTGNDFPERSSLKASTQQRKSTLMCIGRPESKIKYSLTIYMIEE